MRKTTITTLCLVLFAHCIYAQQPSQNTHEKRVYKNNGNTYVQKSLPVYLNFSTSPNGENHALESKATAAYANPMYLDTEGINYIRSKWAVDKETGQTVQPQQEVLFELYADGLSPVSSIRFDGAPIYKASGKVYYGKNLSVSISSKDGVSGVEGINYALDKPSFSPYSSSLNLNSEGAHDLYYYAFDNVGNAESVKSRNFIVDLSAPKSSSMIVGIKYQENIIAPSTRFKLSSTDNLSGVKSTYYTFDEGSNRYYASSISVASLSDGPHTLRFHAVDHVKNEEGENTFEFYLDKIPPVADYTIVGDQHKGNYTYVSERTKVRFSATDNKAGVREITYNMDGQGNTTFSTDFNVTNSSGLHYINYTSTDNVENTSSRKVLALYMDNTAPSTGITYGSPQFFNRDTLFINKDTRITLQKRDSHSGLQKTEYAIDGGTFTNYAPFNITNEGNHTVTFKSTDNVNNVEQVKESQVFVDNTPPEIYINFSIKSIGSKDGKNIYPDYTRMYVGATDRDCGTDEILYSINGSDFRPYSSPYTLDISEVSLFKNKKKYEVSVKAKDKLGNTSEKTVEFYVGQQD